MLNKDGNTQKSSYRETVISLIYRLGFSVRRTQRASSTIAGAMNGGRLGENRGGIRDCQTTAYSYYISYRQSSPAARDSCLLPFCKWFGVLRVLELGGMRADDAMVGGYGTWLYSLLMFHSFCILTIQTWNESLNTEVAISGLACHVIMV
jgi:hypothetical protein